LKISEEVGDRKVEGVTLNNIGEIYRAWGKYDQAIEYYNKDLKICQETADRQGEGVTLNNIAKVHEAQGKYDQAIEYYEKSLKILEEIGAVEAKAGRENLRRLQEKMKK
jgi:tetratricopeptide (TPR) repeat protein